MENSKCNIPVSIKFGNTSTYNQPYRNISYGMLINADSNTRTGYNGADYDFYIEAINGKWSEYLYQYSSTGNYALIGSKTNYTKPFGGSSFIGPGYVRLRLDLSSINYPSRYSILFYSAESFKTNEDRTFTSWVDIPPSPLDMLTSPKNITIRQGEEQLIPAEIKSSSGISNEVSNATLARGHNDIPSKLNPNGLRVTVQRIEPPLFKVEVPKETPVGIYTIHLITSILEPSTATLTKPIFNNKVEF